MMELFFTIVFGGLYLLLLGVSMFVLMLSATLLMITLWKGAKEWKRSFAQARNILRMIVDGSAENNYNLLQKTAALFAFAVNEYGQVYQQAEIKNPSTNEVFTVEYNGDTSFQRKE